MKRKVLLLELLMSMLPLCSAWADDDFALNFNLKDGSTLQIVVEKQNPEVSFIDGVMSIFYYSIDSQTGETDYNDRKELQIKRDEMVSMAVTTTATRIEEVKADHQQKRFFLAGDGTIRMSGMSVGDRIQVVALDSRSVATVIVGQDGVAIIDLSCQPSGIYVVSLNKDYSFKLIKP